MIRLPERLRASFSEPLGPVFTDPDRLLGVIESTEESGSSDVTATEPDYAPDLDETSRPDTARSRDSDADSTLDIDAQSASASTADDHADEHTLDHEDDDVEDISGCDGPLDHEGEPVLVAVGDVVTYHLLEAGEIPDLSVIDGRTEREDVDPEIAARLQAVDVPRNYVTNPPAELSQALLLAVCEEIRVENPTMIEVDGEEDLTTLPAMLVAPPGSSVVYGQPGEGMVHVGVDETTTEQAQQLLSKFDGDTESALTVLNY